MKISPGSLLKNSFEHSAKYRKDRILKMKSYIKQGVSCMPVFRNLYWVADPYKILTKAMDTSTRSTFQQIELKF